MRTKPSADFSPQLEPCSTLPDPAPTPTFALTAEGVLTEKRPAPGAAMWLGIRGQTDDGEAFEVAIVQPNDVADACRIGTRFRVTLERLE